MGHLFGNSCVILEKTYHIIKGLNYIVKFIAFQYPDWLAENKSQVSSEQYSNYERQYHLMNTVCTCFEEEQDADPDDVKQQRFERILDAMQQVTLTGPHFNIKTWSYRNSQYKDCLTAVLLL